ncbi:hypothetical protein, partial [Nocardioides malaquae]|uniref:hypothetical protein n=1 Tax=Nocardioides malaquae TaxID=2773426 RepID=UPI001D0CEB45
NQNSDVAAAAVDTYVQQEALTRAIGTALTSGIDGFLAPLPCLLKHASLTARTIPVTVGEKKKKEMSVCVFVLCFSRT